MSIYQACTVISKVYNKNQKLQVKPMLMERAYVCHKTNCYKKVIMNKPDNKKKCSLFFFKLPLERIQLLFLSLPAATINKKILENP